jgi:arsenate reductase
MAAGLLTLRSSGMLHVRSAGSEPAEALNPAVVEAMAEIGVDMGEEFPKPLTDEVVRAADVVVTMGCGDACPIYPGKRYEDWELDDPADKSLETVRRIRDDIDRRVRTLLEQLTPEVPAAPD